MIDSRTVVKKRRRVDAGTQFFPKQHSSRPTRPLLRDHSSRRGARRLLCRRDHECDPGIPAVGPVLVGKFPVAFEIEITLRRGAQRNDEPELRAGTDDLRLEAADVIARTAVATDLLVDIPNGTDKKLFR